MHHCENKKQKEQLFKKIEDDISLLVTIALQEDLNGTNANMDLTSSFIPKKDESKALVFSKENGILCGKKWFEEVFKQLHNNVKIKWLVTDGDDIKINQTLCHIIGPNRILLCGERTALNFLQTLSGIASEVKKYSKKLQGKKTKLLDTRKTIPGLRSASKYAVLCGGGEINRFGLTEVLLIKENHIISFGSIKLALTQILKNCKNIPIEIEVETLEQFKIAIDIGASSIMLDNFNQSDIAKAVSLNKIQATLEVSGNINLKNIKDFALPGVNYISVGSLTKNIKALDFSMRFIKF